jgi:bifunctional DNA-binding transcriptional regulator/antitoxin component of YhaV-PrlF toxin-antitoxin module
MKELKEKIYEMLLLQESLNVQTNGEEWRVGITKNGKIINWKRCIYMECAELIDSFPWKHWKDIGKDIDKENLQIELVDIWHFIMSYLLKLNDLNDAADKIEKNICKKPKAVIPKKWDEKSNLKIDEYLDIFEELMALSLVKSNSWEFQESLIEVFFEAIYSVEMDFEMLYDLYIGKNVLNKFRQDYGYKEGRYKKIWNGKEDNEVLREILKKLEKKNFEIIYNELEKVYQKIPKRVDGIS